MAPPPRRPDLGPHLTAQTDVLVSTARSLTDLDHPSLCPGWSRAHVLSHLARNADGLTNLVRAAHGEPLTMYASARQRDEDIDAGAIRPAAEVVEDLGDTARAVLDALATLTPDHDGVEVERTPGGARFRARALPFLRLRELAYHHVDLDAGFGFADLPDELQALFLADEVRRLQHASGAPGLRITSADGDGWTVGDGATEVRGTRAALLGWLARGLRSGLDPADPPTPPEGR